MRAEEPSPRRAAGGWTRCRIFLYLLVGLVAIDLVVHAHRHVWHAYDPDDYAVRMRACRRDTWDLVLVGGSPVCEGLDPAVLAGVAYHGRALERVYNLGLSGATTSEVWHAVEHGIGTPPRLLVYGITASDLNDGRDEPHGPCSLMDISDLPRWIRNRPRAIEWGLRQYAQGRLSHVWQLFHYRNGLRLWAADQIEQLRPGLCPEVAEEARDGLRYSAALAAGHGYAPRPEFQAQQLDRRKAAGFKQERFPYLDKYRLGGHLAYLHQILDWGQSHGVEVVLVDMPVSADLETGERYAPVFAVYREALAEVERQRGVRVLRARRDVVGITDADFADLIHLNASGSARLSAWLRRELDQE